MKHTVDGLHVKKLRCVLIAIFQLFLMTMSFSIISTNHQEPTAFQEFTLFQNLHVSPWQVNLQIYLLQFLLMKMFFNGSMLRNWTPSAVSVVGTLVCLSIDSTSNWADIKSRSNFYTGTRVKLWSKFDYKVTWFQNVLCLPLCTRNYTICEGFVDVQVQQGQIVTDV